MFLDLMTVVIRKAVKSTRCISNKRGFPPSRNFTRVNKIEAMYEKPRVNLSEVQLLRLRGTFRTLPLFYLRA